MKTVSAHVNEHMKQRPFLLKYLRRGVVNYRALARQLQPAISNRVGQPVSQASIAISLQRLSKADDIDTFPIGVLKGVRVLSHLCAVSFSPEHAQQAQQLLNAGQTASGTMYGLVQGEQESTALVDEELFAHLKGALSRLNARPIGQLAALVIERLGDDRHQKVGGLAYPLALLAENGMPTIMLLSTTTEQFLVVPESFADQAASLLRKAMAK